MRAGPAPVRLGSMSSRLQNSPGLRGRLHPAAEPLLGRAGERGAAPDGLLRELFALDPERPLRRVPGRETFAWPGPTGPRALVKRTVGDQPLDRWYERLHGRRRSPGRREFDNLEALARDGLPVPRALGWGEAGAGPDAGSLVVMEWLPHTRTLRGELERDPAACGSWLGPLLEVVVRLHGSGWYHRDLYLHHFVLREEPSARSLALLDVGRARKERSPRRRWFVKDLAALLHSTPETIPRATRLRFLAGYLDARGIRRRSERRRWMRDVEAKRRRLAAHRPRFGEAGPNGGRNGDPGGGDAR